MRTYDWSSQCYYETSVWWWGASYPGSRWPAHKEPGYEARLWGALVNFSTSQIIVNKFSLYCSNSTCLNLHTTCMKPAVAVPGPGKLIAQVKSWSIVVNAYGNLWNHQCEASIPLVMWRWSRTHKNYLKLRPFLMKLAYLVFVLEVKYPARSNLVEWSYRTMKDISNLPNFLTQTKHSHTHPNTATLTHTHPHSPTLTHTHPHCILKNILTIQLNFHLGVSWSNTMMIVKGFTLLSFSWLLHKMVTDLKSVNFLQMFWLKIKHRHGCQCSATELQQPDNH